MQDEIKEGKLFATFERYDEFLNAQQSFLELDPGSSSEAEKKEHDLFKLLLYILDEYQEQSHLLDPFLENLVAPVVGALKAHAKSGISGASTTRVGHIALLLYSYIKCRGYKTIIRFFPHEIADLSIALDYMLLSDGAAQKPGNWSLRYVVLLWLSLICMIPFDLVQFDEDDTMGRTANAIEALAKSFLGKAGLEREGAAVLLSRLYVRKDTVALWHGFIEWSLYLLKGPVDVFTSIGILQVLCEVVKSGPVEQVQVQLSQFFTIASAIENNTTLASNTLVRKFKTKLVSRVALRILPPKQSRARRKGRILTGTESPRAHVTIMEDDAEVSEDVESVLEQLFESLQDKDTIVRWSAAKGIARISERLPSDFAIQVLDTITGLFEIHSVAAASLYDLPAIAEGTWHGACLACAEMARRGLVALSQLPKLIGWLSKALYFDLRKGAHSIGSNVRDAAAYVLWALARALEPASLEPHASNLARQLVTVALYDREIHIRRAASAAFQEHVGRTGLFPHGIDVLAKTDFYAVSMRRNAFLIAAPQVAQHTEYQSFLFDHILDVTLRHWDPSLRQLGSESLKLICLSDLAVLGGNAALRAAKLFDSVDMNDIHGGLLALTELAAAHREVDSNSDKLREIFRFLSRIPEGVIFGPRNELVTAAACLLIANSITLAEIELDEKTSVPKWRMYVDFGLKHRSIVVQESAAIAMAAVSRLVDCSAVVTRLIRELKAGSPTMQQSLGRFLGLLDYNGHPQCLSQSIVCLLECVDPSTSPMKSNTEARRNCYLAMPRVVSTIIPRLAELMTPDVLQSLFKALETGLEDYTVDERGDVGSWIRIACIQGLTRFSEILISNSDSIPHFEQYLPPSQYQMAIGGILRQGVERLDNVRQEAGENYLRLLRLPRPKVKNADLWKTHGETLAKELFLSESEIVGWKDGAWLYPKAVRLLGIEQYRKSVLTGLVLSIGSKTDSTQRSVATSLVAYVQQLPTRALDNATYDLLTFVEDLIHHARSNITSNGVVVPVLQTFNVLLEADVLERVSEVPKGLHSLEALLSVVTRNVPRLKSVPRILESMKILVNLLPINKLSESCIPALNDFLAHQFPRIRSETAEYLYLILQSKDIGRETDEAEEILLETEWSIDEIDAARESTRRLIDLLQPVVGIQ